MTILVTEDELNDLILLAETAALLTKRPSMSISVEYGSICIMAGSIYAEDAIEIDVVGEDLEEALELFNTELEGRNN